MHGPWDSPWSDPDSAARALGYDSAEDYDARLAARRAGRAAIAKFDERIAEAGAKQDDRKGK
jgi:hypothetical protein